MSELMAAYDKLEDIPENYRPLFEERGGRHLLTKIDGIKTDADVTRVKTALESEKTAHRTLQDRFAPFKDADLDEIQAKLDKYPELEAAAGDKLDDAKIDELVTGKLASKIAPVQRKLDEAVKSIEERDEKIAKFERRELVRGIHDDVRREAKEMKIISTAEEDVLFLAERVFEQNEDGDYVTKEGVGVTPGIGAKAWLEEMQPKRPHWWPASKGGGAGGSGGGGGSYANNPWSKDHWNVTKQNQIYNADGAEKAQAMAKAANSTIGATRPSE